VIRVPREVVAAGRARNLRWGTGAWSARTTRVAGAGMSAVAAIRRSGFRRRLGPTLPDESCAVGGRVLSGGPVGASGRGAVGAPIRTVLRSSPRPAGIHGKEAAVTPIGSTGEQPNQENEGSSRPPKGRLQRHIADQVTGARCLRQVRTANANRQSMFHQERRDRARAGARARSRPRVTITMTLHERS
jgi:hypothetical protein